MYCLIWSSFTAPTEDPKYPRDHRWRLQYFLCSVGNYSCKRYELLPFTSCIIFADERYDGALTRIWVWFGGILPLTTDIFIFCADVSCNATQPQDKISFQNTVTVFGLPYKMVLKVSDCMCPSSITFFAHFCLPLKILLEDIIYIM